MHFANIKCYKNAPNRNETENPQASPKEHKVRAKSACKDNVFQPIRRPAFHSSLTADVWHGSWPKYKLITRPIAKTKR